MKKIKRIKKLIHIKDNTFKITLNMFVGHSFFELNKELKKFGFEPLEEKEDGCLGVSLIAYRDKDNTPYHTIWLPIDNWTLQTQATLAHELTHFLLGAMQLKGIKIINDIDEPNETFAYLYEYFFYESSCKLNDLYKKTK